MAYNSQLTGKVAIITGGSSGAGKTVAQILASKGVILSLSDVNNKKNLKTVAEKCAQLSTEYQIQKASLEFASRLPLIHVGDLTNPIVREKLVERTLKTFGRLDILINYAGVVFPPSDDDHSEVTSNKMFTALFKIPYEMCEITRKHLKEAKGCILNIADVGTRLICVVNPVCVTSEASIISLSKNLSDELKPYNILVDTRRLGLIDANLFKAAANTRRNESAIGSNRATERLTYKYSKEKSVQLILVGNW